MKKYIALLLAFVMIFCAVSCSGGLESTDDELRTVMTVDEWDVPYEMYRYAAKMHLRDRVWNIMIEKDKTGDIKSVDSLDDESVKKIVDGLSASEREEMKKAVEDDSRETLVNIYSLFTAAKKKGIDPFGEMMNERCDMKMEEIRATYADEDAYLESIKLFFMNDSVYSLLTRYEIVFNDLYEKYVKDGDIDQSDEAVIEFMKGDGAVRAKQIFISFERHSEKEALEIANTVREKVLAITSAEGIVDEAAFDLLTDEYGEDLYMFKNRDGYYMCRGYSDEIFEDAAFSLEVGHASDVVRTSGGYTVIMRAEKDIAYIENNVRKLEENCLGGIYRSILDSFALDAEVKNGDGFEKIDIFDMK